MGWGYYFGSSLIYGLAQVVVSPRRSMDFWTRTRDMYTFSSSLYTETDDFLSDLQIQWVSGHRLRYAIRPNAGIREIFLNSAAEYEESATVLLHFHFIISSFMNRTPFSFSFCTCLS